MNKLFKQTDLYNDLNTTKAVNDFCEFVKFKTVSLADQSQMDFNEFAKLHKYIFDNFPNIVNNSVSKVINKGSIYFKIPGKDPSLKAMVLMGHIDVVPIIQPENWTFDPFAGKVIDGYVCGRGSHDMKHIDMAILQAVEYSLNSGLPQRDLYICFGHDEETLGYQGQWAIKNDLKANNVNVGMVVDEGGNVNNGESFDCDSPLAIVQVMEKGYLDLVIEATSKGGHSSKPGDITALGQVAKAIDIIQSNPLPPHLNEPLINFYKTVANMLTDSKMKELALNVEKDPDSLANYLASLDKYYPFVKTTIAPTMITSDSTGANILPKKVTAVINMRLASFNKVDDIISYYTDLCKEAGVTITARTSINASGISSSDSEEFNLLKQLIMEFFSGVTVVPHITTGGTDCCFYNELTDNAFRFSPIIPEEGVNSGVHGIDEKCSVDSFINGIKFYISLIKKYAY